MKTIHIVLLSIAALILLVVLSFAFGWTDVFYTKTVGKAKQNASREVFEQTQSYVEGKRQELVKLHHEWIMADTTSKLAIEATIRMNFANFDESKLSDFPELCSFLKYIKSK